MPARPRRTPTTGQTGDDGTKPRARHSHYQPQRLKHHSLRLPYQDHRDHLIKPAADTNRVVTRHKTYGDTQQPQNRLGTVTHHLKPNGTHHLNPDMSPLRCT
ncbi:MAG: hypothetical protein JWM45_2237 [Pseudonocardiales bacterium]|jgi:hypothetical protein|nr:hypothetical protein [Pseudonocardiales bacterium]